MKPLFRKHRRLFALGILLACMASWVLPAQACLAAGDDVSARSTCFGCTSPCCDPGDHATTMAAGCTASMLPAVAAPTPSLDKALPAPAIAVAFPVFASTAARTAPPRHPQVYQSPDSVSIRFCTFQE